MKAMVLRGPNMAFAMAQVPDPVAGPGEAVARVITCGAGLTIQHAKAGRRKVQFPRIIGHEITGEIVAVGAGVSTLRVGDGVTSYFYLNCGHCRYCLSQLEPLCEHNRGNVGLECDGGYAEYIKLPAHIFIKGNVVGASLVLPQINPSWILFIEPSEDDAMLFTCPRRCPRHREATQPDSV
jgi:D-arabinose 1-dehydrogenase-like Zn-dependent alcohol dehydrogenase